MAVVVSVSPAAVAAAATYFEVFMSSQFRVQIYRIPPQNAKAFAARVSCSLSIANETNLQKAGRQLGITKEEGEERMGERERKREVNFQAINVIEKEVKF